MNWNAAPFFKNEAADFGESDFSTKMSGENADINRATCDDVVKCGKKKN
jgi:hypothetical protein